MDLDFQYKLFKTLHIVFMTTWMAALFYLPRLYVYHSQIKFNSEQDKTFQTMEKKLIKYIMNPSIVGTWIFGVGLIHYLGNISVWLSIKMILVCVMTVFHIFCIKISYNFKFNKGIKSESFYRLINEIPTVVFILIVILVVFKPFV